MLRVCMQHKQASASIPNYSALMAASNCTFQHLKRKSISRQILYDWRLPENQLGSSATTGVRCESRIVLYSHHNADLRFAIANVTAAFRTEPYTAVKSILSSFTLANLWVHPNPLTVVNTYIQICTKKMPGPPKQSSKIEPGRNLTGRLYIFVCLWISSMANFTSSWKISFCMTSHVAHSH